MSPMSIGTAALVAGNVLRAGYVGAGDGGRLAAVPRTPPRQTSRVRTGDAARLGRADGPKVLWTDRRLPGVTRGAAIPHRPGVLQRLQREDQGVVHPLPDADGRERNSGASRTSGPIRPNHAITRTVPAG